LDTNRDGQFDVLDDPYSAYYPGDDVVDWIGLSTFYRGPVAPNQDPLPIRSRNQTSNVTLIMATASPPSASISLWDEEAIPTSLPKAPLPNSGEAP
jgi:hypothetical protein